MSIRIEEGLRALGLAVPGQQRDVAALDRLPEFDLLVGQGRVRRGMGAGGAAQRLAQGRRAFPHARVVVFDALARELLDSQKHLSAAGNKNMYITLIIIIG